MYCVYKHTSPSGKSYIGITKRTLEQRARNGAGYIGCTAFYRAIQKYGWEQFSHEILEDGLNYEQACERERYYIKIYRSLTTENGYNLESGGCANTIVNKETRLRISKTLTGRKTGPMSLEQRQKLSEAKKGKKMPPRDDAYRKKLSAALTGRVFSEEHRKHISEAKLKANISGKNNPHARAVLCVETGVVFDTVKEAGEFKGGSPKNIISCCRGRLKTSGGYHWRYAEEVGLT